MYLSGLTLKQIGVRGRNARTREQLARAGPLERLVRLGGATRAARTTASTLVFPYVNLLGDALAQGQA